MSTAEQDLAGLTKHQLHLLRTNVGVPTWWAARRPSLASIAGRHGEEI